MQSSLVVKVVGFLAALSLASGAFAGTQPMCKCGPPTPESYKWNFSQEATGLLSQLYKDAYQVRFLADQLEGYNYQPYLISWQSNLGTLQDMKGQINDLDHTLCRLRIIERVLPREQRAEVNKVAPAIVELTDTAQSAILYLNNNHDRLFVSRYTAYIGEMYQDAGRIERATKTLSEVALTNTKTGQTAETQNLRTGS